MLTKLQKLCLLVAALFYGVAHGQEGMSSLLNLCMYGDLLLS